ncbi:chloride channel protein [Granulicella sp. WH15]|uniref:chloride channel protein n=1 Tax=Granulicella sp. WH15 TaxID=2602070 RepID=UPI001C70993B|nr:chloride channel protein [Granulicella sp. WH15]
MAITTVMVGIAAGIGGMALGLLLRFVQHVTYGYSLHAIIGDESFLQGVSASSPLQRVAALFVCGIVAGVGWWAVYRFGSPLISISKAVEARGPEMPFFTTVSHTVLQIVTVGMGSPLGREVAPREVGAVLATRLSSWAGLKPESRRILIACGAGAGLAAVYNVPLGGALFTLEVLLGTFSLSALIPALVTSVIGALVAWIGLGNQRQYAFPYLAISPSLVVWSVVSGPLFGLAAHWFVWATRAARSHAPRDRRLILWCLTVFPVIGLLAVPFPQLLGNGKSLTQLLLESELGITLAVTLVVLRILVTLGALYAGAEGGLLTPGLTIGALLGTMGGALWNHLWPSAPLGAFAIVGGAAFLASSMKMPLTAIVLVIEFTRVDHDFLIPTCLAVAGSISVSYLLAERNRTALEASPLAKTP